MKACWYLLIAVLALAAPPTAAAEQATTTLEEVVAAGQQEPLTLCGFYQEGGKVLEITQSGDQVTAKIVQGQTGCLKEGDVYFTGTLTGIKFSGKMQVCNPDICVEAGIGWEPVRETDFKFTAFEKGRRLIGSWVHHEIQYREEDGKVVSCRDVKAEDWSDFRATQTPCYALQKALEGRKKALALYQEAKVNANGGVLNSQGREVAADFDDFQAYVDRTLNPEGASGRYGQSGQEPGGGATKYWELEDVVAGNSRGRDSLCWCEPACDQNSDRACLTPYFQEECLAHETVHCDTAIAFCENSIKGKSFAEALNNWNRFQADTAVHLADEIVAYEESIRVLEEMLAAAGCQ